MRQGMPTVSRPIIVAKDNKTKMVMAKVAPRTGAQESVLEVVRKFVEQVGHDKVIMKSNGEPAILALKEAVRREASAEIVMEEAPVGDHLANRVAENAAKNAQGQFRVLKTALEIRINKRVEGDHRGDNDLDGRCGAGDQFGEWRVNHRNGRRSGEGEGLQRETGGGRTLEQRRD